MECFVSNLIYGAFCASGTRKPAAVGPSREACSIRETFRRLETHKSAVSIYNFLTGS